MSRKPKLDTYASHVELRRLKRLREAAGISQTTLAHALHTPLRTWQSWEDGKAKMHRVIYQAAMGLLEAAQQRTARESEGQASHASAGLPLVDA